MLNMHNPYEPMPDKPWRDQAACADAPDVDFFVTPDDAVGAARAKALCASCPVADDCLAFSIETNQNEGIWGGTTPPERAKLRRMWLRDLRAAS